MIKANKTTFIIMSIVTMLPMFIGLFFWNRLPDTMAIHFNFENEADGFGSKALVVFGVPLFLLALLWIVIFVMARDPKKENVSPKIHTLFLWIIPIVSSIVAATLYPINLGYAVDVPFVCGLLLGFILIVIGNYLPKARQNYSIGIRIPWTLASERNWNRTHRLAGYLWVAMGILIVVCTLCNLLPMLWIIAAVIFIAIIIPPVYSYCLHLREG